VEENMKKVNILSVIEPKKDRCGRYGQWDVWVVEIRDEKAIYKAHKTEHEYNAFILEQEFLSNGIDPKKLEQYRSEVYNIGNDAGYESGMCEAGVDMG
jgi:hypothetical protein